jgi:superfamily II DNA or RNA helicase
LDKETCQLLTGLQEQVFGYYSGNSARLTGKLGALALENMINTGRCLWRSKEGPALRWGDNREFNIAWQQQAESYQLSVTPECFILPTEPPLYWDRENHTMGRANFSTHYSPGQLELLQLTPTVPLKHAEALSDRIAAAHLPFELEAPVKIEATDIRTAPTAYITLDRVHYHDKHVHCLWFEIKYDGHPVHFLLEHKTEMRTTDAGRFRIHRNLEAENTFAEKLASFGFNPAPAAQTSGFCLVIYGNSVLDSANQWFHFLTVGIPELEAEGWVIEQEDNFRMLFFEGEWSAETEVPNNQKANQEPNNDWFDVRFDLTLENNQTLPLAPLLAPLLGTDPNALPEQVVLPLGDDKYTNIRTERLKPYLETLNELFQRSGEDNPDRVKLSRFDLATIDELGSQLLGAEALQAIAKRLKDFTGIETVPSPEGLQATLRPYQQEGLNWLQFLRQYAFNGILADDKGLGKTLQAIAHILTEKNQGRLTSPALIVAPTSLMGNWRHEVEKFAPELSILVLHGTDRHDDYATLETADIVVTTYALAHRDLAQLKEHRFHLLILDEAQAIKNPLAKIAQSVRELRATHRLCLTGTPMENHLGELWSLFDFLMPGFLSTHKHFKDFYRNPIEKQSDKKRLHNLQKRISPFILRRTKNEVASELPPKTEIQHLVAMPPSQAKLYESIRVTMDQQVKDTIAAKGLAQSHITVLDALLKLRQTCCDPRLLKMDLASAEQHSAKMEALTDLLEQLLSENRRVLIFSQFTTMLGLIEETLKTAGISLTKLTGKTRHREKAIEKFRSGKADVFLISLKAGGTGLNLTEADAVIIYDPWWNPAAENQAIDRAHRIGQEKPVFVYRLIVENSVEEKIVALQTHKQALADGIYDDESPLATRSLDAATIQSLFAPMTIKN